MLIVKEAIKEIIREFYEEGLADDVIPRDIEYYESLTAATVIKGMRRTGKTFITYARIKALLDKGVERERIVHINFEDDRIRNITADQLRLINEAHAELFPEFAHAKCWYFLDELQNIPGWEAYARRLVDSPKVQLCLTGSSAKLLSAEIATEMRGRDVPIEVFPLSFREFLRFNGIMDKVPPCDALTAAERGILRNAMSRYFRNGGFPAVQAMPDLMRIATLQEYVHSVLYRDVLQRHEVKSVQALTYTLEYLLHNYGRKISARAISGVLKNLALSNRREDIANYLDYFKEVYFTYPISTLSDSLAVKRVNPDKYYIIDTGLINAMHAKTDAENGWKLENLVYMTLRRKMCNVHYVSLGDNREVDFHVDDSVTSEKRLVQVSWDLGDDDTIEREYTALCEAKQRTGINDCTIVTWDTEKLMPNGIRVTPIWKWCLEEL